MPSKRTKTSDRTSKILNTSVCFGKGICTTKFFSLIIKDTVTRNGSLGRREIAKMVNSGVWVSFLLLYPLVLIEYFNPA